MGSIRKSSSDSTASAAWRHPLLAPLNSSTAIDRLLQLANPRWSVNECWATVLEVVDETARARSLWLKPNGRFRGFRAGQHVLVETPIKGARHARCYSFSAAPRADGRLRITVQRQDGGAVSNALQQLRAGDVVRLGEVQGEFFAPHASNRQARPRLLISAGSGITPMLALLHAWAEHEPGHDVVLVHSARDAQDVIGHDELQALAHRWPQLSLQLHYSGAHGRLDPAALAARVPEWREHAVMACGPDGLLAWVEALCAREAVPLVIERFGARPFTVTTEAGRVAVHARASAQVFTVAGGQNLLEGAEAAGLRPAYGCRRGICRTCQCRKFSGRVTNLLTGQTSGPGEELIQLCISAPLDAVELVL